MSKRGEPMNLDELQRYSFPAVEQHYDWRASALYGLSVGFGQDQCDAKALQYVTEKDQLVVPTQAMVLGYPGPWLLDPALGVNYLRLLHGAQHVTFHGTLKPAGSVIAYHRVIAVDDKGVDKGATLYLEKRIESEGRAVATVISTIILRGDGGNGGFGTPPESSVALPEDVLAVSTVDVSVPADAALLYRLNGDVNPLHSDPATARKAGFDRPILHGLCSMGIACRVVLQRWCDHDPSRLRELTLRFASPVYPGEAVRFEFYEVGRLLRFRAYVPERGAIVLDRGEVALAA